VIINWLHFADHEVARFRRSPNGSISPISNRRVLEEELGIDELFEGEFEETDEAGTEEQGKVLPVEE
jgi:hypothetical protein